MLEITYLKGFYFLIIVGEYRVVFNYYIKLNRRQDCVFEIYQPG